MVGRLHGVNKMMLVDHPMYLSLCFCQIHERKTQMNSRIMALRDTKVSFVSWLRSQAQQLQAVQERLAPHFCSPAPTLPSLLPEETPERKLRYTRTTLQRYGALRAQR